jgi:hypothetical protein
MVLIYILVLFLLRIILSNLRKDLFKLVLDILVDKRLGFWDGGVCSVVVNFVLFSYKENTFYYVSMVKIILTV